MTRAILARMNVLYCGKFLLLLVTIALSSVGCGKSEQSSAPAGPKTFASAEIAGQAIYSAAKAGDTGALLAIFGPDARDFLLSGDPTQDKAALDTFSDRYDQMHRWGKLTRGGLVLDVGAENYPFPFALKKNSTGEWYFDTSSAKDEILARRIGGNELSTIDVLNAMNEAQAEYFGQRHDGSSVHAYAQKFVSDDGKQNGLYWKVADGQPESPLGPLAADASTEGYSSDAQGPQPYHGYFFRMITKEGPQARGGAKDFLVSGNMTGGFAILAYPAEYGNSGVVSFLVNQDGDVFQKDLGANTAEAAKELTSFNPDDTWSIVE
jgi:hypothetical protein